MEASSTVEANSVRPSLCLVQLVGLPGADRLREVLSGFARCEAEYFKSMVDLLPRLSSAAPAVIVIPGTGLEVAHLQACVLWARRSGPAAKVIVVEPHTRGLRADLTRLAKSTPSAHILTGNHRLTARLVEAVLVAIGVQPRVHLRSDAAIPGSLETEGGEILRFEIFNLSESGAKLRVDRRLPIGEPVRMRFELDEEPQEVEAVPMRLIPDSSGGGVEIGVQFEQPGEKLLTALRAMVRPGGNNTLNIEPIRAPRQTLAKLIKVSVRIQREGSSRRDYLAAEDISATGLRAAGAAVVLAHLAIGDKVEMLLSWTGQSFKSPGTIVRAEGDGESASLAIQFDGLGREGRSLLQELLSLGSGSPREGLRGRG
jgi:PilZ domain